MPFQFDDDDLEVLDRTTLEGYSTCPTQARLSETLQKAMPAIAEGGEEIHQALSRTITSYVEASGVLSPHDLRTEIETNLFESRTDLQPDVIAGFKRSVWKFSEYLTAIHFQNILRYDGGEGVLSGQLSWDFETVKVRVTSEIDLLYSTESPSLLKEVDWKTGWKKFTESDVRESFQFQLHAFLVLMNYPDIEAVQISAWNTRFNFLSWSVEFRRNDLEPIRSRILKTIQNWWMFRRVPMKDVPAWPVREKCRICDYAIECPVADAEIKDVQANPEGLVNQIIAATKRLKEMKSLAKDYVKTHGDIVTSAGDRYGFDKPKSTKRIASLYRLEEPEEEAEEGAV